MGEDQIDLIVCVDDILIYAKTNEVIERTAKSLIKRFPITDLGVVNHHLGVQVMRNKETQDAYYFKIPFDSGYIKVRTNDKQM
ncbi:hypothetical protein KQX54_015282 [Cotesia glomerata]|uniref:Reverse transcriptase n=1 Tax=Cotesia glomerata TaxID=32391 RepID=A0AAV7HV25_COTGL|nr:hypothetical protein KQX54_015282 [Cotesia glomerata]